MIIVILLFCESYQRTVTICSLKCLFPCLPLADLRQRSFDNSVPAQLAPWAQTCSASSSQKIPSLSASVLWLKSTSSLKIMTSSLMHYPEPNAAADASVENLRSLSWHGLFSSTLWRTQASKSAFSSPGKTTRFSERRSVTVRLYLNFPTLFFSHT
jgi:hypothetical protein